MTNNNMKASPTSFLLATGILLVVSTIVTPATMVFAVKGGNGNNNNACPDGFEKNKGVCQAEPTLTCENYNVNQERVSIDENGVCQLLENASPACDDPGAYYDIFTDRCEIGGTDDPAENQNMNCGQYTELGWTVQRFDNRWQCVGFTALGPADEKCETGTLNEESGMCEVKPGHQQGVKA